MAHVATVTIDHTKVAADLTDYVVLVVPNSDAGWASLYAACLEGGGDIRVYKSDDTTELPREIVSFSASGETGEIYLKFSGTLSSSVDTDIHIYCDGSSSDYAATDTYGRNNVWTGYRAVWHLNSTTDSTGNGYTLTNNNSVTLNATGKNGGAADFTSGNTNKSLSVASDLGITTVGGAYSVTNWVNLYNGSSSGQGIWTFNNSASKLRPYTYYELLTGNYTMRFAHEKINSTSVQTNMIANFANSTWYYMAQTYDASTMRPYIGSTAGTTQSSTGGGTGSVTTTMRLGSHQSGTASASLFMKGLLDEFRVASTQLSANWLTTEYNNQNSPTTFYSVAEVSSGSNYTQNVLEAVTANDSIKRDVAKAYTENAMANDTIIKPKSTSKTTTDNVTLTASITTLAIKLAELLENVNIADSINKAITKAYLETVDVTATIIKDITRAFTEAVSVTASALAQTATYAKTLLESVAVSDSLSKLVGYVRSFSETVTATVRLYGLLNGVSMAYIDQYAEVAADYIDQYTDTVDDYVDQYFNV